MIEQLQSNAAGVTPENGEIDGRLNVSALGDLGDVTMQLSGGPFLSPLP
jgi:hypothetical protein